VSGHGMGEKREVSMRTERCGKIEAMNEAGGFKTAPLRNGVKALVRKAEGKEENSGLLTQRVLLFWKAGIFLRSPNPQNS
jgi:hypothetical protein